MRDLLVDLDSRMGRRAGLEHALRRAVQTRQLAPGERVPSTRSLADDLGISRSTVVSAYEQLIVEGYLKASVGSGTTVANLAVVADEAEPPRPWADPLHDFRPGQGDGGLFPRTQWLRSVKRVLSASPDDIFGYSEPAGRIELRRVLASYLGRSRAVASSSANLSIFNGATSAVSFLGELFGRDGHRAWAIEDPALFLLRSSLASAGVELRPVPLDDEGIEIEGLERTGARVVMVTPAHQYPMGITMSARRRTELVEWARDVDGWIVEDDYDGEFRYDRRPIGSLQGLDPERVVYVGSASKTLAAGLRLGWLVLPVGLRARLDRLKHMRGGSSVIDQLTFADLVVDGGFDRHLRQVRTIYRRRRQRLMDELSDLDWLEVGEHEAGLHLTARILDGRSEQALIDAAQREHIGLLGLAPHWMGEATADGLVIGYTRLPEHRFGSSLDSLGDFLRRR